MPADQTIALVVDLDGTLLRTDMLPELWLAGVRAQPLLALAPLAALLAGKASLKARLAVGAADLDVTGLPYEADVLALAREARAQGREVVLVTASHQSLADRIAEHLGVFDEVHGTRDGVNLNAERKRDFLVERFGDRGYDYIGNSRHDEPVWRHARHAIVVNARSGVARRARAHGNVLHEIATRPLHMREWLRAMRPHQWLKNLLVFVPLLAAHRFDDPKMLTQALLAFVLFGLCASSVYVANDLLDLADDRRHARKRLRPFAAGNLPAMGGMLLVPMLLALAFGLSIALLPPAFTAVLAVYWMMTFAYSLRLKRIMMVDVMLLALLYTMRIIAGAAATGLVLTFWILAFSMFMFLSLALVKRFAELRHVRKAGGESAGGRGYHASDLEMLSALGAAAGYLAVMVLALYINDADTVAQYERPQYIWLACPLLLYWISRVWMLTHRGQMHDDPVLFAVRDRVSLVIGGLLAGVFWLAT